MHLNPIDIPEISDGIFASMPTKDKARCTLVCKHWYSVVTPHLWHSYTFFQDREFSIAKTAALIQHLTLVRALRTNDVGVVNVFYSQARKSTTPLLRLKSLRLAYLDLDDRMYGRDDDDEEDDDEQCLGGFNALKLFVQQHCTELEYFRLWQWKSHGWEHGAQFSYLPKTLTALELEECLLTPGLFLELYHTCPQLKLLHVELLKIGLDKDQSPWTPVYSESGGLTSLTTNNVELHKEFSAGASIETLMHGLLSCCPNLEQFAFDDGCNHWDSSSLAQSLQASCRKLKSLKISRTQPNAGVSLEQFMSVFAGSERTISLTGAKSTPLTTAAESNTLSATTPTVATVHSTSEFTTPRIRLEQLTCFAHKIPYGVFMDFCRACSQTLTVLDLALCFNISGKTVYRILTAFSQLEKMLLGMSCLNIQDLVGEQDWVCTKLEAISIGLYYAPPPLLSPTEEEEQREIAREAAKVRIGANVQTGSNVNFGALSLTTSTTTTTLAPQTISPRRTPLSSSLSFPALLSPVIPKNYTLAQHQQLSHSQSRIYDQFSRLTFLRSLRIHSRKRHDMDPDVQVLPFTLASGMGVLSRLEYLSMLSIRRMTTQWGPNEVDWLIEHFPRLQKLEISKLEESLAEKLAKARPFLEFNKV